MLVIRQTWRMLHVLTGLSSWSVWLLTNSAAGALVLTGGGLGGCRSVCAKAGAAGEVRLTYSDRSISNWGAQEPTNQSTAQHSQSSSTEPTGDEWDVDRWKQQKQQLSGEWTHTHTHTHGHTGDDFSRLMRRNTLGELGDCHQPNSVYSARDFTSAQHFKTLISVDCFVTFTLRYCRRCVELSCIKAKIM